MVPQDVILRNQNRFSMANPSIEIIDILRRTTRRLKGSSDYQWGHMGSCNCGFLAQEISSLNKMEIHQRAMERHGDWNEQLNDYCMSSGLLIDGLITTLVSAGFTLEDLKHLERLSDPIVLEALPPSRKHLQKNSKEDVILYIKTWSKLLENEFVRNLPHPEVSKPTNWPEPSFI